MEFFDVVNKRRSVRRFTGAPVPPGVIEKALDAALLAPNSSNMQLWEFYWVRTQGLKKAMVEACFSQPAAATAAELVFVVSRIDHWRRNRRLMLEQLTKTPNPSPQALKYYRLLMPIAYFQDPLGLFGVLKKVGVTVAGIFKPVPRGPTTRSATFEIVTKSAALAAENLMLALVDQGYASCPMEGYDEVRVKQLLGLGRDAHVVMAIGIGVPHDAGIYGPRLRFDRNLFVFEV